MRQISEIVRHQKPIVLPASASVQRACKCMRDHRVGAVLVTEGDRLIGIFTARDVVGRVIAENRNPPQTALADVMTKDPHTLPAGKSANGGEIPG